MLQPSRVSRSAKTITGSAARRLASVFADTFGVPVDRVHPDLAPVEVERWDSVGHVALVTAVEHAFSIQFDVDEIMEFTSFRAILSAIERRISA